MHKRALQFLFGFILLSLTAWNVWVSTQQPLAREQGWLREGEALRVGGMPWPLIRALGTVMPTLGALAALRYLWNRPHRLDNRRLRALIGDEPHTPWPLALQRTLQGLDLLPAAVTSLSVPARA